MHPLQNGSQATVRPAQKPLSGTPGWFTESGDNNVPSYPGADWFNHVIAEFQNALSDMGLNFIEDSDSNLSNLFLKILVDSQEKILSGKIFPSSAPLQVGDSVPEGTKYLRLNVDGVDYISRYFPQAFGQVSDISASTAIIGGTQVSLESTLTSFPNINAAKDYGFFFIGQGVLVGKSKYLVVPTSTVSPNGFNIIQCSTQPSLSLVLVYGNHIDIEEWGFVADGVANDKMALQNLMSFIKNGDVIQTHGKLINIGAVTDADVNGVFNIQAIDNISILGKPRWVISNQTTGGVGELKIIPVFKFTDCNNLNISCDAYCDSYDLEYPHGPAIYYVENDLQDTEGLFIDCYARNAVAACMIEQKFGSSKRLRNVNGKNGGENITYCHRAFQSGDDATLTITAKNHARSFYPIGVKNQIAFINSVGNQRVNDVLIKCYVGEQKNINVFINQVGSVSSEYPVLIEHENQNDSQISSIVGVNVTLHTDKQYFGANPEFFAIRQRITGAGIADFSLNETDEISLTLLGNQVSSAAPKVLIASALPSSSKGTIYTNITDDLVDTKGFTFKKSDLIKVKRRGPYADYTKALFLQQVNRATVCLKICVFGVSDYTTGVGRFYKEFGCIVQLDDLGGGTILQFVENTAASLNPTAAPDITLDFSNFNVIINTANDTNFQNANSEIAVSVSFRSNI